MNTEDLFAMGCVTSDLHAVSKKQLFQEMAELAIQCGAIGADTIKSRDECRGEIGPAGYP